MNLRPLIFTLIAFGCVLAVLAARGDDPAAAPPAPAGAADAGIRRLEAAVRRGSPVEADLAAAYLQQARATGEPSLYDRARTVLRPALARGDAGALVQAATLAATSHDFRRALGLARRSRAASPGSLAAEPVRVDALVELGRYAAAERVLQRLVDRKPGLAAYARVSYVRELHGDLDGAVAAMRAAAAAGGAVPEDFASAQALVGHLEVARRRPRAAARAYDAALLALPECIPALAGRARLASLHGDHDEAVAAWRRIVARLPLPEHVLALGEAELAAGHTAQARRDLTRVIPQRRRLDPVGVRPDAELALFEADHGDPRRAVALARAAYAAAPSVRSADALGWALTRSGRPAAGARWAARALRLGWQDAPARFHAGMAEVASGRAGDGRRHLRAALAHGLDAFPLQARAARAALGAPG